MYWDLGRRDAAIADYARAVELDPELGMAHDSLAVALLDSGRKADAVARWKLAIRAFEDQQNRPNLADSFWTEAPAALRHIGERGAWRDVRPEIESLLRSYLARHDSYRADSSLRCRGPLRPARRGRAAEGRAGDDAAHGFSAAAQRIEACRRLIQMEDQPYAIRRWQLQLAELQFGAGDTDAAAATLAAIPRGARPKLWKSGSPPRPASWRPCSTVTAAIPRRAPDIRRLLVYASSRAGSGQRRRRESTSGICLHARTGARQLRRLQFPGSCAGAPGSEGSAGGAGAAAAHDADLGRAFRQPGARRPICWSATAIRRMPRRSCASVCALCHGTARRERGWPSPRTIKQT